MLYVRVGILYVISEGWYFMLYLMVGIILPRGNHASFH